MKIQKSAIYFAFAALLIFAFLPVTAVAQENNASLQETLTWIKSKANLIAQVGTIFSRPNSVLTRKPQTQYFNAGGLRLNIDSQCTLNWRNPNAAKLKSEAKLKVDAEA